ncbi:MAG: hypothetical protein ACREIV_14560, partial [Planctomycetaceae bacterium]
MTEPVPNKDGKQDAGQEVAGVLDLTSGGAGFLRTSAKSFLPNDGDIYVPAKIVQRFRLRPGDEVAGEAGVPPGRGKNPPLVRIATVNGVGPEELSQRPDFNRLSAQHPNEQLVLECDLVRRGHADPTNRLIDLFCP